MGYSTVLWKLRKSFLIVNAFDPICPIFLKYLLSQIFFLLFAHRCVFNPIQRDLFQVSNAQLPSTSGVYVVQGHTFIPKQAGIIRAYRKLNPSCHQIINRVRSQVSGIPQNHVAEWAALDADVLFPN